MKVKKLKPSYSLAEIKTVINASTWTTHYDKLYSKYVSKYNAGDHSEFNHGGYLLHELYFEQLKAKANSNKPVGASLLIIQEKFGDFRSFKQEFEEVCSKLQGSGWVYLSTNGTINTIEKHRPAEDVAMIIDLWEHAYVETFGAKRDAYVRSFWSIIDWEVVSNRMDTITESEYMRSYVKMLDS